MTSACAAIAAWQSLEGGCLHIVRKKMSTHPSSKSDLVITLACCTMGDSISSCLLGNLYLSLGNQWPSNRGPQQIDALVQRVGSAARILIHHCGQVLAPFMLWQSSTCKEESIALDWRGDCVCISGNQYSIIDKSWLPKVRWLSVLWKCATHIPIAVSMSKEAVL